jgi:putative transposase
MGLTPVMRITATGRIEDLSVPRDRASQFHTQAFERYSRYDPQVAAGLTEMFGSSVSTQKVGDVAQTLMGVAPSASTISRLNHTLTEQFDAWRERSLHAHYRVVYAGRASISPFGMVPKPMRPSF